MIFDTLNNAPLYEAMLPRLRLAFEFARTLSEQTPDGRVDLPFGLYANVMSGRTKPHDDGPFEAHRRYYDVQVMIAGHEVMETANLETLKTEKPYDAEIDASFSRGAAETRVSVRPGCFYLLAPWDAHRACICESTPCGYKKVVVKVPIQ